jgi:hypothetical protein
VPLSKAQAEAFYNRLYEESKQNEDKRQELVEKQQSEFMS